MAKVRDQRLTGEDVSARRLASSDAEGLANGNVVSNMGEACLGAWNAELVDKTPRQHYVLCGLTGGDLQTATMRSLISQRT